MPGSALKHFKRLVGTWETKATHPALPGMVVNGETVIDARGVFRVYAAHISEESWGLERVATGFSQRFTGTFREGDRVIAGRWQAREDDVNWVDDLEITYQRILPSAP